MEQLYVDNSTIPYTGKGLFTSRDISKDELIVEYFGEITIGILNENRYVEEF